MRLWTKRRCVACLMVPVLCTVGRAAEKAGYELAFSTYVGGERWEHARDICTDSNGNMYVVGRSACLGPQGELCATGAANGAGWPIRNAVQATFAGTNDGRWGNGDCIEPSGALMILRFSNVARQRWVSANEDQQWSGGHHATV